MEKTYGALVAEQGKEKAERFFPKPKGKKTSAPEGGAEGAKQPE